MTTLKAAITRLETHRKELLSQLRETDKALSVLRGFEKGRHASGCAAAHVRRRESAYRGSSEGAMGEVRKGEEEVSQESISVARDISAPPPA
jgi:hypothetical protein